MEFVQARTCRDLFITEGAVTSLGTDGVRVLTRLGNWCGHIGAIQAPPIISSYLPEARAME